LGGHHIPPDKNPLEVLVTHGLSERTFGEASTALERKSEKISLKTEFEFVFFWPFGMAFEDFPQNLRKL